MKRSVNFKVKDKEYNLLPNRKIVRKFRKIKPGYIQYYSDTAKLVSLI